MSDDRCASVTMVGGELVQCDRPPTPHELHVVHSPNGRILWDWVDDTQALLGVMDPPAAPLVADPTLMGERA